VVVLFLGQGFHGNEIKSTLLGHGVVNRDDLADQGFSGGCRRKDDKIFSSEHIVFDYGFLLDR
jgi:hypothetical protein